MKEFTLPFKPEELLAQPADGRLWASDLPDVESWSEKESCLFGSTPSGPGEELAKEDTFSLLFAVLQAWPRLDESLQPRVVDLLADAAKRLVAEAGRLRGAKSKERCRGRLGEEKSDASAKALRNVCKVSAFFLRWTCERLLSAAKKRPGRTRRGKGTALQQAEQQAAAEEAKEASKALERQRALALNELHGLLARGPGDQARWVCLWRVHTQPGLWLRNPDPRWSLVVTLCHWLWLAKCPSHRPNDLEGAMPWLWLSDPAAWQQVAGACSDGGFCALDSAEALKGKETKQAALQCIAVPLLQEGQQHSNLLVATVSKLLHGLRDGSALWTPLNM
eukprot:g19021.t1